MRILLLTHIFNSLTQRLYVELARRGHTLSVEYDIHDSVTEEAVDLFAPDLVLAPFLKRAIPESVWRRHLCWIVHPGPRGDRGPSSLDWAVLEGAKTWGVTVLQAEAEMDAGPVWASIDFPMREAAKGSLYRREVTEAAVEAVLSALERLASGLPPVPLSEHPGRGRLRQPMRRTDRVIDWQRDDTAAVLRKVRSADGFPGLRDEILGREVFLYDAHPATGHGGPPGAILARSRGAICRATTDGAVWIGRLRERRDPLPGLKLPAAHVLGEALDGVPEAADGPDEIHYEERDGAGWLYFDFHNGAMDTAQCERLRTAFVKARRRGPQVLVLMGGEDFWSNGLHLHLIEAAENPADASWANINAMDDLCREIIECTDRIVITALSGNAGGGGVFLALAADHVWAAPNVVLNAHYKNMGNLYGSEYWTYLLPRRLPPQEIMGNRLPLGAPEAARKGLIDDCFGGDRKGFLHELRARVAALSADPELDTRIDEKRAARQRDEAARPLSSYREAELERMRLNFYGFDPSYHIARYNFCYRVPLSRTPLHLARHRTNRPG